MRYSLQIAIAEPEGDGETYINMFLTERNGEVINAQADIPIHQLPQPRFRREGDTYAWVIACLTNIVVEFENRRFDIAEGASEELTLKWH